MVETAAHKISTRRRTGNPLQRAALHSIQQPSHAQQKDYNHEAETGDGLGEPRVLHTGDDDGTTGEQKARTDIAGAAPAKLVEATRRQAPDWNALGKTSGKEREVISSEPWVFYTPLSEAIAAIGQGKQIIRNWLPSNDVTFILADRGLGKSTVLIDLALTLATDQEEWMGYQADTGYYAVYVCGESCDSTMDFAQAWYEQHGIALDDREPRFMVAPRAVNLLSRTDCEALVAYLKEHLPTDAKPVVFIDTWGRSIRDTQLKDDVMNMATDNAEYIGKELRCPIVAAVHPPKTNKNTIAGSLVVENSSKAIWNMKPVGNDKSHLELKVTRMKGPGEGSAIRLRRKVVQIAGVDSWGNSRTGTVLVLDNGLSTTRRDDSAGLNEKEAQLLANMTAQPAGLSFVKRGELLGWPEGTVRNVYRSLSDKGLVMKAEDGHYYLTETGERVTAQPTALKG